MSSAPLFAAELSKIAMHRTPKVCAAVLTAGSVIPSAWFLFREPADPVSYMFVWSMVWSMLSILLAVVFGGWLLGTEYRQGTVRRMLAAEPRRLHALGVKGLAGLVTAVAGLVVSRVIAWGAARSVAGMNDVTLAFEWRVMLAGVLYALATGTVAFGLSAISRSDSFAMVGTIALALVVNPLLSLIPKVGDYAFSNVLDQVTQVVAGESGVAFGEAAYAMTTGTASLALGVWLATILGGGAVMFVRRDV